MVVPCFNSGCEDNLFSDKCRTFMIDAQKCPDPFFVWFADVQHELSRCPLNISCQHKGGAYGMNRLAMKSSDLVRFNYMTIRFLISNRKDVFHRYLKKF